MSGASGELLLVIDVGNTNTVLGLYEGAELAHYWRIATDPERTTDELGVLMLQLLQARGIDPARIRGAMCASVVPPVVHATRRACKRYFGVQAQFVGADVDLGIEVRYRPADAVGADRLVNALAAHERHGTACIIVDFGTATTFDVVAADGSYEGGVIAPGIGISMDALFHRAAKLPRVEIVRPGRAIGHATVESMQAGIVYGYVGLVDGIVDRILGELRAQGTDDVRVIATGGLAGLISAESRHISDVERFLTLDGLRMAWERVQAMTESIGASSSRLRS